MSLKGKSNCKYVAWEQLNTVLAPFTPPKCSVKYTSLFPLPHVKCLQVRIKAQHFHVPAARCGAESKDSFQHSENLTFWYPALLSQCCLHLCSQVIRKVDTLCICRAPFKTVQSALVVLQMHRFETSDDDKNHLIRLAALQKNRSLLAILVAYWLIHSGALR